MSFDIGFIACNAADRVKQQVSPFTGDALTVLGGAISDAQRESINQLLDTNGAAVVGDGDAFAADFSDGGSATVWFAGYHESDIRGGTITVDQLSLELSSLIHSLLTSGNLALMPAESGEGPIVPSAHTARDIANRWPNARGAESPAELQNLLPTIAAKGQEEKRRWQKFW
jgi:hypothetical protein